MRVRVEELPLPSIELEALHVNARYTWPIRPSSLANLKLDKIITEESDIGMTANSCNRESTHTSEAGSKSNSSIRSLNLDKDRSQNIDAPTCARIAIFFPSGHRR